MGDPANDTIAKLQEENLRLKRKLEELSSAEKPEKQSASTVDQLRSENLELRESLLRYRSLEEELAVQRVFEKSKKKFYAWLTLGGSVATVASIVGIMLGAPGIKEYIEKKADDQIQKVTGGRVDIIVADRIKDVIDPQLAGLRTDFEKKANEAIRLASLPDATKDSIDYTSDMEPVRDEGPEGATAGFAVAAAMEYQIHKNLSLTHI